MKSYSVLHGFQGSAGQPGLMARGLLEKGVEAANVIVGPNKYGYDASFHFQDSGRSVMREVLTHIASRYDIIHVHAITPFFLRGEPTFPMGTDLLALKAAGKKIVVHFRGSEIRLASVFQQVSPFNYVNDDPEGLVARFPEDAQRAYIELCRSLADEIVVSDAELATYVPGARLLQRAIDLKAWPRVKTESKARPLVVHAPSRKGVKGTSHVLAAVEALQNKGVDFDFRLVHGLPQPEARELYEAADVIIDQLRIGWYGVLAVEGMALGKAVVSYIRDDLLDSFDGPPPVMVATPLTVEAVLHELIADATLRETVADRGHEYCRRVHDSQLVAQRSIELYDDIVATPQGLDFAAYMAINAKQEEFTEITLQAAKKLGDANARRELGRELTAAKNAHAVALKEVKLAQAQAAKEVKLAQAQAAKQVKAAKRLAAAAAAAAPVTAKAQLPAVIPPAKLPVPVPKPLGPHPARELWRLYRLFGFKTFAVKASKRMYWSMRSGH